MKLTLVVVAIFGLSLSAPSVNLQTDLLDFAKLIPFEEIKTILDKHLRNDPEFQAAIQYLQGPEWDEIMTSLDKTPQMLDVKKYVMRAGVDLDLFLMVCEEMLGDIKIKSHNGKPSMKKFFQEVNAVMPYAELIKLFGEKLENSPYFQDFFDKISSDRFHKITENLLETDQAQNALDGAEGLEVYIRPHIKAAYAFLGWEASKYL